MSGSRPRGLWKHLRALDNAVEYNDEGEEKFLRRLWRDLYSDEPI